jgi:hypothetical protein
LEALVHLLGQPAWFAELDRRHHQAGAGRSLRELPDYLDRLDRARALLVVEPLAGQLAVPATDRWDDSGLRVVNTLLTLAFGDEPVPAGTGPADLGGAQRAALTAIARSDKVWIYGNVNWTVRSLLGLGQRDEREQLTAWLADRWRDDAGRLDQSSCSP